MGDPYGSPYPVPGPSQAQGQALRPPAQPPTPTDIGYSPERLGDYERQLGGVDPMMEKVMSARYGEAGADPTLTAMAPGDRAALDRYANLAVVGRDSPGWRAPIDYAGSMLAMTGTEAMKLASPIQRGASYLWNKATGNQGSTQFFGGKDTSPPSLTNITSAHYGFMRGRALRARQ